MKTSSHKKKKMVLHQYKIHYISFLFILILVTFLLIKWTRSTQATTTGNVVTMGRNESGQLGIGSKDFDAHGTPSTVSGLSNVVTVSVGTSDSYAVKSDGTVWAWGQNNFGQLGDNSTTLRTTPVQVVGAGGSGFLTNVTAVASYDYHTLALKNDGTVWAWGANFSGELGIGTFQNSSTPAKVVGPGGSGFLTGIIAVAEANGSALALKSDGTVWAWGNNISGQLGNGTTSGSTKPVQVVGVGGSGFLNNIIAIAEGSGYSLALKSDGTVWAWGQNGGNLGNGTTTPYSLTPVEVVGPSGSGFLTGITAISAGDVSAAALKNDGTVWTWGMENSYGELGNGSRVASSTPVEVNDSTGTSHLSGITAIYAGGRRVFAKTGAGTVWGWGEDNLGELGDGASNTSYTSPTEIINLKNAIYISTGYNHSIAIINTNKPPAINPISNVTINEGGIYSTTGSFTDPDSTSWIATVDYGDGSGTQNLPLSGQNFTLSHQYIDEGTDTVTVKVTDNQGATGTGTATVTVNDAPPTIGAITVTSTPVKINASTTFSAPFIFGDSPDIATWKWGDGSTTNGTVSETNGSGSVTNSHIYTALGSYTVQLSVTNNNNLTGTSQTVIAVIPTGGLQGSNLKGTNYSGANLSNQNLGGTNLMGGIFTNTNFQSATLTNLNGKNASFQGDNFTGANLSGSNFKGSNFTNANFTNANLQGTNFAGAILTGVTWSNTTCPNGTNSNNDGGTCVGQGGGL